MAPESGRPHPGLAPAARPAAVRQILAEQPEIFDFFQAVRLLQWQARREADAKGSGTAPEIGEDTDPAQEPVRFRAAGDLGFPPATVTAMAERNRAAGEPDRRGTPAAEMMQTFMGLTGPSGVLPLHYTDRVLRETRAKNTALRDFLDLFNHRLVSLFYRSWAKYRLPVSYEHGHEGDDPVTAIVAALVGLGGRRLRNRLAVDDRTVLHFGGAYARRATSAAGIEALASAHFGLPVRIRSFQGRWIRLARPERSALAAVGAETGCFARLAVDAVAGEMVFDAGGSFRLRIGPMLYRTFTGFVPGGQALREIVDLARLYAGPELDFDVQCVVRRDQVPTCRLGGDEDDRPLLGWNTWLVHEDRDEDAGDPVFRSDDPGA